MSSEKINPESESKDQQVACSSPSPCFQQTLATEVIKSGVGLHSGINTTVKLLPAPVGTGRCFVRIDLPDAPIIPAQVAAVSQTVLSTQLGKGEATVRTVEHLLAALAGMGVDNVRIEIDQGEVPLLDGSALEWVDAIAQSGLVAQAEARTLLPPISQPIWVNQGDTFVAALPAPQTRFTYGIDFEVTAIGNQWHSWSPGQILGQDDTSSYNEFATEIAPARTFGLAHQIEFLRQQGLIKGGSLANALVCDAQGWLNPPLRFANEPVRHKILDLVGDLSLVGLPTAHFFAYKASHNLHIQLAQKILDAKF